VIWSKHHVFHERALFCHPKVLTHVSFGMIDCLLKKSNFQTAVFKMLSTEMVSMKYVKI